MGTLMNLQKTLKNTFRCVNLFGVIGIMITGCVRPEVIIHDAVRLSKVKSIQLLPVEVHSMNFDPYLSLNLIALAEFELQRAGYKVMHDDAQVPVQTIIPVSASNNQTNLQIRIPSASPADASLKLFVMHSRSFRDISEEETLTILGELTGADKSPLCSVLVTESGSRDLLKTGDLSSKIRDVILHFKTNRKK